MIAGRGIEEKTLAGEEFTSGDTASMSESLIRKVTTREIGSLLHIDGDKYVSG